VEDSVHGIFLSSVTGVRGDSLVDKVGSGLAESDGALGHSQVSGVPFLSERVAVVHEAVTSINFKGHSTGEVLRLVVVFSTERHTGAVGENRLLGKLLSLEEHGECITSTVLNGDFLNLKGVV
jgi:hypothetical protein